MASLLIGVDSLITIVVVQTAMNHTQCVLHMLHGASDGIQSVLDEAGSAGVRSGREL